MGCIRVNVLHEKELYSLMYTNALLSADANRTYSIVKLSVISYMHHEWADKM